MLINVNHTTIKNIFTNKLTENFNYNKSYEKHFKKC